MSDEFVSGTTIKVVPPTIPSITVSAPPIPAISTQQPSSSVTVVPVVGPPGPSGGSTYEYTQLTPSTVWTINHNLGRYPATVQLYASDLSTSYSEFIIQHLDVNTLRISMDTPTAGIAFLV